MSLCAEHWDWATTQLLSLARRVCLGCRERPQRARVRADLDTRSGLSKAKGESRARTRN